MSLRKVAAMRGPLLFTLAIACAGREDRTADTGSARTDSAAGTTAGATAARRARQVEGFKTPESVRYDETQDVYFVSNINGNPSQKDNNGFISRVRADGTVDSLMFVAGGRGGVTLNAPKGMAIVGDTLWVADIDALRAFDKRTGAVVANVDMARLRVLFLNDVAAGPDGTVYVTDTGIRFGPNGQMTAPGPQRILQVKGRTASVALQGDSLGGPNGITWDPAGSRFLVASFGANNISAWKPGDQSLTTVATGVGQFDGVEVLSDGSFLASSWADSSIYQFRLGAGGQPGAQATRLIMGVPSPADFGHDGRRNLIAIPIFTGDRVEFWELPR
jgi:sugar lactone lactonase YvrE